MEDVSSAERIKRAALKEFALHGFEGARVDRIAQKAKINKAMIYYHYKGKENLYEEVLSNVFKTVFSRVTGAISEDKRPDEQLESIFSEYIEAIKMLKTKARELCHLMR